MTEWVETTLGEVADVNPESTPKSWGGDRVIRYIDIASVSKDRGIATQSLDAFPFGDAPGRARRIVRAHDVIVSTVRPNLRAFAQVPATLDGEVASTGFAVVRSKENCINPGFIWCLASSDAFADAMVSRCTGSNYPAIRGEDVAQYVIQLPSLAEQRRIVDVMATVDAQIEALRAESAALAVTRKATLGELQGVADDSRQTTLGDLVNELGGSIKTGPFGTALKAREYAPDGVPVISTGEVRHGFLQVHPKTPLVGADTQERLSSYLLRHGDIVFARKGAVDRSAWVKQNETGYFLGSDGLRVRINVAPEDSRFFAYLLQSDKVLAWLELNATGTIMKGLNQKILAAIPMGIPHDDVRHGYVARLDLIERVFNELVFELTHLRALRSTLLSSLLSQDVGIPESYDDFVATDREVGS